MSSHPPNVKKAAKEIMQNYDDDTRDSMRITLRNVYRNVPFPEQMKRHQDMSLGGVPGYEQAIRAPAP